MLWERLFGPACAGRGESLTLSYTIGEPARQVRRGGAAHSGEGGLGSVCGYGRTRGCRNDLGNKRPMAGDVCRRQAYPTRARRREPDLSVVGVAGAHRALRLLPQPILVRLPV